MKYIPPLESDSANEAYVDADIDTGINGSIVPAKIFNNLQKEILNVITAANITPNDTVLTQLNQAINKLATNITIEYTTPKDPDIDGVLNNNLNNLVTNGTYFIHCTAATRNAPIVGLEADWWITVNTYGTGANRRIMQQAVMHALGASNASTGVSHQLVRVCSNTTFSAWQYTYSVYAS